MKKKYLALILSLILSASLFSVQTWAETNIIPHGGFNTITLGNRPYGWNVSEGAVCQSENKTEGDNALKLTADAAGLDPFVWQQIEVVENSTYTIRGKVLNENVPPEGVGGGYRSGVTAKVDFYTALPTSEDSLVLSHHALALASIASTWQDYEASFQVPQGVVAIRLYFRLYGVGTAYWDEVSLAMTETPPTHSIDSDAVFYYSEQETGTISLYANTAFFDNVESGRADFFLRDGDREITIEKSVPVSGGKAVCSFPLSLMEKEKTRYQLCATLFDSTGGERDTVSINVYRYPRPACIRSDGTYLAFGKPFYPVVAYHADNMDYAKIKEAGINVVQMGAYRQASGYVNMLKKIQGAGLYAIVPLYLDRKAAFHPDNAAFMEEVIRATRDFPNIYAYAVMDEPYNSPYNDLAFLEASYVNVRRLAPDIPVYLTETAKRHFGTVLKYCDVFCGDPYPVGRDTTTKVSDCMQVATNSQTKKHILHLAQAFDYGGWAPTGSEIVHQSLQALFEGVHGVGYFKISNAYSGKPLYDTDRWQSLVEFGTFLPDLYRVFSTGEYETVQEVRGDSLYMKTFQKGEVLYMVLLNRREAEEASHSLPYAYPADLLYGSGTLSGNLVTIPPAGYAIYKLIPTASFKDIRGSSVTKDSIACKALASFTPPSTGTGIFFAACYQWVGGVKELVSLSPEKNISLVAGEPISAESERLLLPQTDNPILLKCFVWHKDHTPITQAESLQIKE
ncbi:MAG: hypothetical protein PUB07_05685 [Clostridia bacterium]|nr:hypothetical protein [Clostridia bacterium]